MHQPIKKLTATLNQQKVFYHHPVNQEIILNNFLGNKIKISWNMACTCLGCLLPQKSLQQGYCFRCSRKLAICDLCILKPELCHFHLGTCREPSWGLEHCMNEHVIYLAMTSQLKIGITRRHQIPTRWIDQGASWAVPLAVTFSRLHAGLLEVEIAKLISDKTDWRDLLTGVQEILNRNPLEVALEIQNQILEQSQKLKIPCETTELKIQHLEYPILQYCKKAKTVSLEKTNELEDRLIGIRGQYLLLENNGGLNIRKYSGYHLEIED
jgi:hypothetical protein